MSALGLGYRRHTDRCLTTRQYSRLVSAWIAGIDLDPALYGIHSLRRTKATLIYRRTGYLRAVQLLLGRRRIESTVRYLGIEVDDALAIARPPKSEMPPVCARDCRVALLSPLPDVAYDSGCHEFAFWCWYQSGLDQALI